MKLVTTSTVFTRKVKNVLDCVTATAVVASGIKDNFTMNWSDAGEFIERLTERAVGAAKEKLSSVASQAGADAVLGVNFDIEVSERGQTLLVAVTATGTAVELAE
jgi:uncharacterized protein YbjQ (UPF0145 family)